MRNRVAQSFWLNGLGLAFVLGLVFWFVDVGSLGLLVWLGVVNVWLFALMAKDKRASGREGARTPELVLLALGFAGASPVLLFGRKYLNHKTKKESFVAAVWAVVVMQAGLLLWYLTR